MAPRGDPYIDTSALLRLILRETGSLSMGDVQAAQTLVSSELLAVESHRTIDRLRLQGTLSIEEAVVRSEIVREWLESVGLVLVRPPILARASEPLPTPLGTLAAIHLVTALVWRDRMGRDLVMATHHSGLATAARALGTEVLGADLAG